MIYAYDLHMQMPVKDLYDTQIMAIAINAAKDMYEKGLKQLDDFIKNYGDFYSPIAKDMENYNNLVIDPFQKELDNLYANGIDPLRSAEGRARLARINRSVPIAKVNQLRESAKNAEKYLDNLAKLQAAGKYNPDYERFRNPVGLDQWDTLNSENGTWLLTSPYEFQTLKDATSDWFDKRTAYDLTADQMKKAGYEYDPRYDYTGYLWDDLYETAGRMTPGWHGSPIADFYRDQARKQLEARGINATPDAIEKLLQYNVAEANREYIIKPQRKANEYELDAVRTANDIKAHAANAAIDDKYDAIKWYRENPDRDPKNYNKDGVYIGPKTSIVGSQGGDSDKLSGKNHNYFLETTGITNLFTPGGGGSYLDYLDNYNKWGNQMRTVEDKIAEELAQKKVKKDGKITYYGILPRKWIQRHYVPYDEAQMPEFFRQPTVKDVNGEDDGKTTYVSETIRSSLFTEEEVASKNKQKAYSGYFKKKGDALSSNSNGKRDANTLKNSNGGVIRTMIRKAQDTPSDSNTKRSNIPLVTSTGKIFSQVELDNKVHHYFVVKLKYLGGTRTMYIDTGLDSEEGGLSEDVSNYNRNRSRDMSATMPNSASKAAAYEATH